MTPIVWSKVYWNEWAADFNLRACSLAARGLWFELICIAAPRGGYLADDDGPLAPQTIAAMLREPADEIERLMRELEANKVFLRDGAGRIYLPRLLNDVKRIRQAREDGAKGGRASRDKQRGIFAAPNPAPKAPASLKSQESEIKSHESAAVTAAAAAPEASPEPAPAPPRIAPLLRAVEVMGTTIDALHRKMAWMAFDYTFANWLEEGCDAERDVWPTIAALCGKLGKIPSSPAYFTDAVREARARREAAARPPARTLGAPYLVSASAIPQAGLARTVDPQLEADRRDAFARDGVWSTAWGPKPDAPKQESEATALQL